MKSGDYSVSRDDDYFRGEFSAIKTRVFVPQTFSSQPALLAKESESGHRVWHNYDGAPFDESKFELVPGMWDHEHCSVCFFSIQDGHTYWSGDGGVVLLCDACHEALASRV